MRIFGVDPEDLRVQAGSGPGLGHFRVIRDPEDSSYGVIIVVEAQTEADANKRWMLPWYQAALAKDHRLPAWVVVVSFSDRFSAAIAAWREGPPPRVDVLLIDAHTVAPILDLDMARNRPTAAVLAATLHGCRGDLDAARIAARACLGLPEERRDSYKEGRKKGRTAGRKQGRKEGHRVGMKRGLEQGRRDTLVELIFTVLEVRGVRVSAKARASVRACEDLPTLERWARRAREVEQTSELFEPARC